ncbi:hypothetical protein ACHQM5_009636 [Ranunculus cassubicifolius]
MRSTCYIDYSWEGHFWVACQSWLCICKRAERGHFRALSHLPWQSNWFYLVSMLLCFPAFLVFQTTVVGLGQSTWELRELDGVSMVQTLVILPFRSTNCRMKFLKIY